jgi:hypothetical protein
MVKREIKTTKRTAAKTSPPSRQNVRILPLSTDWITVEHFTGENVANFFHSIAFPQREQLARFTTNSI